MLIQRLQKWWIENSSLLTCVKTIQNFAYCIILDCFYMREIGLDFSIHNFWSHWITTVSRKNESVWWISLSDLLSYLYFLNIVIFLGLSMFRFGQRYKVIVAWDKNDFWIQNQAWNPTNKWVISAFKKKYNYYIKLKTF